MNFSWNIDTFDSQIFGFKTAKITKVNTDSEIELLLEDFKKNDVKYATFRIPSDNYLTLQALQKAGFVVVDGILSLNANIRDYIAAEEDKIREAKGSDIESLKNITRGLFLTTRIYNDSFIPKNKADDFYMKWIENSVLKKVADSVLVWEDGEILGYITLQKKGQIPLMGVSDKARGKGIGIKLVNASFKEFINWGLSTVVIETQINNIPAVRLYESCGFKTINSFFTLSWKND